METYCPISVTIGHSFDFYSEARSVAFYNNSAGAITLEVDTYALDAKTYADNGRSDNGSGYVPVTPASVLSSLR